MSSTFRTASDIKLLNLIKPDRVFENICDKQDGDGKMIDSSNDSASFHNSRSPSCNKKITDLQNDYVSSPELEPTKDIAAAFISDERSHNRRWKSESNLSSKPRPNRSNIPLPATHFTVNALSCSFGSTGARSAATSSSTLVRLSLRRSAHSSSQPSLSGASPIPDYSWVPSVVSSRIREQRRRDRDWRTRRDLRAALDSVLLEEPDGARSVSNQDAGDVDVEVMSARLQEVCRERDEQTQRLNELQDRYIQLANRCAEAETFIDRVRFLPVCQAGGVPGPDLRRYGSLGTLDDCLASSSPLPQRPVAASGAGTLRSSELNHTWSATGVCAGVVPPAADLQTFEGLSTLGSSPASAAKNTCSATSSSAGVFPPVADMETFDGRSTLGPGSSAASVTHGSLSVALSRENAVDAEECSSVGGSTGGHSSVPATPPARAQTQPPSRPPSLGQKRVSWHESLSSCLLLDQSSPADTPGSGFPGETGSPGSSRSDASPSTQLLNSTLSTVSLSTEKDLRSVPFPIDSGVSPPKSLIPSDSAAPAVSTADCFDASELKTSSIDLTDVIPRDSGGKYRPGTVLNRVSSDTASYLTVSKHPLISDSDGFFTNDSCARESLHSGTNSNRNSTPSTTPCDHRDGQSSSTATSAHSHDHSHHHSQDHSRGQSKASRRQAFSEGTIKTRYDKMSSALNETETDSPHLPTDGRRRPPSHSESANIRSSARSSGHRSSNSRSLDRTSSVMLSHDQASSNGASSHRRSSDRTLFDRRSSPRRGLNGEFLDLASPNGNYLGGRLPDKVTSARRSSDHGFLSGAGSDRISERRSSKIRSSNVKCLERGRVGCSHANPGVNPAASGVVDSEAAAVSPSRDQGTVELPERALSAREKVLLWQCRPPSPQSSSCSSAGCSRQLRQLCSAVGSLQREISAVKQLVRQRPPSSPSSPVPLTPLRAMVRLPTSLLPDRLDIGETLTGCSSPRHRPPRPGEKGCWDDKYPAVERAVQTDSRDICEVSSATTTNNSPCLNVGVDVSQLALRVRRKSDCLVRRVLSESPSRDKQEVT